MDKQQHGHHLLAVRDLHAHYGRVCALRDLSFETECGRSVAIVGGNGAGKTTLMKAIVGLVHATTGVILWKGMPVVKSTPEIAYLPQRQDVDWRFPITVRGLVEMGRYPFTRIWRGMTGADHDAVEKALCDMQIEHLAARQIGALSGGQQQRAFIAKALAQEAHVLLLDEPFTGLDQPSAKSLALLMKVLTQKGCLIMASHHDVRSVEELFDEVLLLNHSLIAFGAPGDVMTEEYIGKAFSL